MKILLLIPTVVAFLTKACLSQDCGDCQSYGIDFLNDGSYFQNSDSSEPFTALQEFEGCANDTSHNVFVDPNGEQYECTMSQLQPDNTPQLVTCPVNKDELFDGEWSLLILSNNGGCEPIDYQRDFELSVGSQQTTTVSPTVVVASTSTPIVTVVQTVTSTITQTANPSTTTVPRATLTPTVTKHPLPSITIVKKAIFTVTKVKQIVNIVSTTFVITTPRCKPTNKRRIADPVARIAATILGESILGLIERDALPAPTARSGSTEFKRAILEEQAIEPEVKARFLRERRERLKLKKRFPDEPVVTVTDGEGEVVTSTIVSTADPTTIEVTSTIPSTTTITPTITVSRGVSVTIKTVTAPRKTITLTKWLPVTTVRVTRTKDVVLTITETSTSVGASASCAASGGKLA